MAAPQNSQGFVQPSSGGVGNWVSKLFGGISDQKRSRSAAQLQLDLHAGKADIDTFHKKDRMTHQAAIGEYTADSAYRRSGKEIRRGIKYGPKMGEAGVAGFDRAGRPTMQKTGQRTGSKQKTDETTKINPDDTPPGGGGGSANLPKDRAKNPGRQARGRKEAGQAGVAVDTAGTATKVGSDGKLPNKKVVTEPDSPATAAKVRTPRKPKAGA
jgi:hypothetical protein